MTWYRIEMVSDNPNARYSDENVIGKVRLEDDGTYTFEFDTPVPASGQYRLVELGNVLDEQWDGGGDDIDFFEDSTIDPLRQLLGDRLLGNAKEGPLVRGSRY